VAALFLPHTDVKQFPKLKRRLDERKSSFPSWGLGTRGTQRTDEQVAGNW